MNRRAFLFIGKGEAGGSPVLQPSTPETDLEPFIPSGPEPWDYTRAAHLLRRAMIGPTDAEIRRAVEEGLDATIDRLMQPFETGYELIEEMLGDDPAHWPPDDEGPQSHAWRMLRLGRRERLGRWWLKIIAESPVSIQERMTIFWHSHFVCDIRVAENAEWMLPQIELLRRNMLGNFRELAREVSKTTAMLHYLDGAKNHVDGDRKWINENYARELMELFTMGIVDRDGKPNYTQEDVVEVARALSGWTYTPSPRGERYLRIESRFVPSRWDSGKKTFFGRIGYMKLDDVIDVIFEERAEQISRFLCEKLYKTFVSLDPEPVIVDAMARTLRENAWEVRPVIEQLLRSRHFFAPGNIGALPKSHVDYHLGMIRSLGLKNVLDFTPDVPNEPHNDLHTRLLAIGQMLFYPPSVQGWHGGRGWVNVAALPPRQKFATDVAMERIAYWNGKALVPLYTFDPIAFAKRFPEPNDLSLLADDIVRSLLSLPPSAKEQERLFTTLLNNALPYEWNVDDPDQQPAARLRFFMKEIFTLGKFQLY